MDKESTKMKQLRTFSACSCFFLYFLHLLHSVFFDRSCEYNQFLPFFYSPVGILDTEKLFLQEALRRFLPCGADGGVYVRVAAHSFVFHVLLSALYREFAPYRLVDLEKSVD